MSMMLIQVLSSGTMFPLLAMLTGALRWPLVMNDAFLLALSQWIGVGALSGLVSSALMVYVLPRTSDLLGFFLFTLFSLPMALAFAWMFGAFTLTTLLLGVAAAFASLILFCTAFWLLETAGILLGLSK